MNGKHSVMSHSFARVAQLEAPRSTFDRSHGIKTTFDSGYLVPFYVDEALPGDTFNMNATLFSRLTTPLRPVMDNLYLDTFFFAVPYRLVWSNWEKFNGAQANPGDSTSYLVPTMTAPGAGGVVVNTLSDYMGVPIGINSLVFNSLHHRAYNLIWNTWFRDQNLQSSLTVDTGDGPDTYTNYTLQRRGKRHDYFTSCLPWPQKGTAVTVPLGTSAKVITSTTEHTTTGAPASLGWRRTSDGALQTNYLFNNNGVVGGYASGGPANPTGPTGSYPTNLIADLSTATSATINALRQAFQIQKVYERDARGGTRYTEIIKSHFGVTSPDQRLQRPEYLGGGSSPIVINPVPQQSASGLTGGTTKLGDLAGYGTVTARGHGFVKSFTEHCLLIGLVNVRADLNYQQGLNRMFSRQTRWDFYWPELAQIGEQAVLNKEIYADGSANDALTFGYQERYAEYRYKPSQITGKFRSTYSTPLDDWHLAQKFTSLPTLNSTFIQDTPPVQRVLAVGAAAGGSEFYLDGYLNLKCARPMPVFGVPGNIDHF